MRIAGTLCLLLAGALVYPACAHPNSQTDRPPKEEPPGPVPGNSGPAGFPALIDQSLAEVKNLSLKAADEKDILKLNCVQEKNTVLDGLRKIGLAALEETRSPDPETTAHGQAKLKLAIEKTGSILEQARRCLDEPGLAPGLPVGQTQVSVNIDPQLPENERSSLARLPLANAAALRFSMENNPAPPGAERLVILLRNGIAQEAEIKTAAVDVDLQPVCKKTMERPLPADGQDLGLFDHQVPVGRHTIRVLLSYRGKGAASALGLEIASGIEVDLKEGNSIQVVIETFLADSP